MKYDNQKSMFNMDEYLSPQIARPFFQYPGGKRRLASWIVSLLPSKIDHYYEPFLGGGAVFWHIIRNNLAKKYSISDFSKIIYTNYVSIRDDFDNVMSLLEAHYEKHSYDYFFSSLERVKYLKSNSIFTTETSALDIYIKRSSIWSTESRPADYGEKPIRLNTKLLKVCSRLLQGVQIDNCDYPSIVPEEGSVIYCDPPYINTRQEIYEVVGKSTNKWKDLDNVRLADSIKKWVSDGKSYVALSSMIKRGRGEDWIENNQFSQLLPDFSRHIKKTKHMQGNGRMQKTKEVYEVLFTSDKSIATLEE